MSDEQAGSSFCPVAGLLVVCDLGAKGVVGNCTKEDTYSGQSVSHGSNQLAGPDLILTLELSLSKYKNQTFEEITLLGGMSPTFMTKAASPHV